MNRNFTQMITVQCSEPEKLIELIAQWDHNQASADIMGYMGHARARRSPARRPLHDHG